MINREAQARFRDGLRKLEQGNARDALPLLDAAVSLEHKDNATGISLATYRSYQGLCQCLAGSEMYRGLRSCRQARKADPTSPAIWYNLGRAALILERRAEAHRAFRQGLRIQPGHPGITRALRTMGVRRRPVLGFLHRQSFVNVALGRLRTVLAREVRLPVKGSTEVLGASADGRESPAGT
jgi:Tfp pilus assembly protein PilF